VGLEPSKGPQVLLSVLLSGFYDVEKVLVVPSLRAGQVVVMNNLSLSTSRGGSGS
jgi:hypothetical protein